MSVSQYNSYKEIIKKIDEMSKNTKEKGDAFERLCKTILEKASFFHSYNIDKVWLWNDFPYDKEVDTGIDIVVKTIDDEYWAVQCKCFLEEGHITKKSIDSFLAKAASGFTIKGKKINYKINYLFHTSNEDFSKNAKNLNFTPFGPNELEQCGIDWASIDLNDLTNVKIIESKKLRPHQQEALEKVINGFKNNDRGQLIMACGTGKTFTSLKIVEEFIKTNNIKNSKILYLVPSIALLSQTVIEWSCQTTLENVKMFGICSDATAGKHKLNNDEYVKRMPIPSTTNINELSDKINEYKNCHQLIFSTYQSIDVVSEVQKQNNFVFDLIICDEAHRTIGSLKKDDTEDDISNFIKVHDNKNVNGIKRLYMTATPKIYGDKAKEQSKECGYEIISMDDENIYGPEFYDLTFSDAISKDLLTDYRLVVMNINKNDYANSELIKKFTDKDLEDNTKLFGVLSALSKKTIDGQKDIFKYDPNPIRRTVAFTKTIKQAKFIAEQFNELVEEDYDFLNDNGFIIPNAKLITGSDSASEKENKLNWLREDFAYSTREREREQDFN